MRPNQGLPSSFPLHDDEQPDVTQPEIASLPDQDGDAAFDRETLKTGTTTVGVRAEDGVVLATDRRASLGNMVSSKAVQKVEQIHPTAGMTISGSVSAAQSLIRAIQSETKLYETRRGEPMSMQALSTLLSNLLRSGAYLIVVPVVGGVDDTGPHLYSIDALGGTTEEDYTTSGSGTQFALGVLENRYEDGLSMDEAADAATDAVATAMERDTASGNGLHVARVTSDGVEIEAHDDITGLR